MVADLERSSVGIDHGAVSFSFACVEQADVVATIRPQVHPAAVSPISEEPTIVHLAQYRYWQNVIHRLKKTVQNYFLSELVKFRPIVKIFGTKIENKLFCGILIFHLTLFVSTLYRVKRRCSILLHNTVII